MASLSGRWSSLWSPKTGLGAVFNSLFANVLILALGLGTGVFTARILGPSGRGELTAIIMWPQFLAYMFTFGLPESLLYALKRTPEREPELVGAALVLGIAVSGVAVLTGVFGIPYLLHSYSAAAIHEAQWVMLTAPIGVISLLLMSNLRARSAFGHFNRLRFLQPLFTFVALLVLFAIHWLNPFTAALAYLLAGLPIFFWQLDWLRKTIKPCLNSFRSVNRGLISYGVRAWGTDLLGTLGSQVDRVLVVALLSQTDMGLYIVAQSLARVINIIPSSIIPVLMPKAAGHSPNDAIMLTGRATSIALLCMIVAIIPLLLLASVILRWFYGTAFVAATFVFQLLVGEAVLRGMVSILAQSIMALGRPGLVTILQGVGLAVTVLLLALLVPRWGLVGAGSSLLCSMLIQLILILASFPLVLKKPAPSLWPRWRDILSVWVRIRGGAL
jgi:O-antigen/teichoic acid export membrane protein